MAYTQKQKDVLSCLLLGAKRFKELKTALVFKHDTTLFRQLEALEKKKLISHSHLDKTYKITSKGFVQLGEIDDELKGRIFTAMVIEHIDFLFNHDYIFDSRLSKSAFDKLFDMAADIEKDALSGAFTPDKENNIMNEYLKILMDENLTLVLPKNFILRDEFFILLKNEISDITLYLSIKVIEERTPKIIEFLKNLPGFLAARIIMSGVPLEQFRNHLLAVSVWDNSFNLCKSITCESYKKVRDAYKKAPLDMQIAIGEDFAETGWKYRQKQLESIKNSRKLKKENA